MGASPPEHEPSPLPRRKRPVWLAVALLAVSAFFGTIAWFIGRMVIMNPELVGRGDWVTVFGSAAACVSWAFVAVTLLLARSERAIALLAWPWWILNAVAIVASILTGVATFFR